MGKLNKAIYIYLIFLFLILAGGAFALGKMLAATQNIKQTELFVNFNPALPSRILDIRGDLITEFSVDEKRELINFEDVSPTLIQALLAREDRLFYKHKGFRIKSIFRAIGGQLLRKPLGGGSTITQQIAGLLYSDRTDRSVKRKLRELWWAIQMERRYSKDEIMTLYLNEVYFGGGTNGASAAARFYFGHSASEVTPAEAALLVIQLSNPTRYNPFDNPNIAKERQEYVLQGMVDLGYLTKEEAYESFEEYWSNFDYTRIALSAWFTREDKARWFSEYVRRQLDDKLLYGTMNLYKDGFTVHTTCDLRHQEIAEREFQSYLKEVNKKVSSANSRSFDQIEKYSNVTGLLSLVFGIDKLHVSEKQLKLRTSSQYRKEINPTVDVLALMCGIDNLKTLTKQASAKLQESLAEKVVEGAFVSIENETGYITAIIGGSQYSESNQLIRSMQSKLPVGSVIKPLIYSAALDTKKITPATRMDDTPQVFENAAGVQYIPNNYGGKWRGTVLVYQALPLSLNIPAIKTLEMIGFDAAINRIASLTGITDQEEINRTFERVYPLALGISAITPIQLLRAFAIFGNQGRAVDPIAVRSVENRDGTTVLDPEMDLRIEQRKKGSAIQVVSPQNAYVMTQMLRKTLTIGTMTSATAGGSKFEYKDKNTGNIFRMPVAAKSGTTQNWSDSWAVIYSPYYSAIVWYGFDRGGQSLGTDSAGALLSGYVVANFMRDIHQDKPYKEFVRPEQGVINVEVCRKSGMLPSANCTDGTAVLAFLYGTQPGEVCTEHTSRKILEGLGRNRIENLRISSGEEKIDIDKDPLSLDPSIFVDPEPSSRKEESFFGEGEEGQKPKNDEKTEDNPWL